MIILNVGARALEEVVALARLAWVGRVLRGVKLETQSLFKYHVVDSLDGSWVVWVDVFVRGFQPFIDIVVRCEEMVERNEFLSKRIEG